MLATNHDNISALEAKYSNDVVVTDYDERVHCSQDIFTRSLVAAAVIKPRSIDQLAAIVSDANRLEYSIFPRGGGVSYTSGYVPNNEKSLIFDLRRLDAILEINEEDMYVIVEAGCTWKVLYEALSQRGLRTPFWGSLSGLRATVGGSISQSAIFWGAGNFGSSSDSVIGMSVVIADGSIITTGSGAHAGTSPFARYYGPDLTGLFCCDCGALGIKATVTLKLISERIHQQHLSYEFSDYTRLVTTMSRLAREEIAAQMFATDPGLADARAKRESLIKDLQSLNKVVTGQGSLVENIVRGARIAANGRSAIVVDNYSLHISIEQSTRESAKALSQKAAVICERSGGKLSSPSIPTILRSNPFGPLNNALGPTGERWVPIHAIVPHSKAIECIRETENVFHRYKMDMENQGITTGYLLTTVHTAEFVIEPLWFWPDKIESIHEEIVEESVLKKHKKYPRNPKARALVESMRAEIKEVFSSMGATHLQIGRSYNYAETLDANTLKLLKAIKAIVDPSNVINPGCLGI